MRDTFRSQAKDAGLKYSERFAYKSLFKGVSVRINRNDVGKLEGIASVSNVYPAHYYTLGPVTTADPELATAIKMTGADIAQASSGCSGRGVKVAVIDTGIDYNHPDLRRLLRSRLPRERKGFILWDFVGDAFNDELAIPVYNPRALSGPLPRRLHRARHARRRHHRRERRGCSKASHPA